MEKETMRQFALVTFKAGTEKAFSSVTTQKSFAHRAIASAEQKIAEAPGHPLCSEPAIQAAQGHGSNLKAHFLHPNIMSG